MFGPRWEKLRGSCRKLYNEKPHDLYCSPNIIKVITPRSNRWTVYVARMARKRNAYRILVGKLKKRGHLDGLCVGSRITLKRILKKLDERTCTGFITLTTEARGGLLGTPY
jgi:hypothetical protein